MSLKLVRRASLVESVVTQLRTAITAGDWPVGTRIPTEDELVAQFGVGRNTLREAVRVLIHAGMLDRRQGAGTFVLSTTDAQNMARGVERAGLKDRLEVRQLLETGAARLAAKHRTRADCAVLEQAVANRNVQATGRTDAASVNALVDADAAFHNAIVAAAHNAALADLYQYFSAATRQSIHLSETEGDLAAPDQAAHSAVVDAIVRGDSVTAATLAHGLLTPLIDSADDQA